MDGTFVCEGQEQEPGGNVTAGILYCREIKFFHLRPVLGYIYKVFCIFNNLLEQGEQFEITLDLTSLGENKTLSENLTANDTFNIQVKPSLGSTITIQRTLPPAIEKVMDLH